ncbi:hypothetical protein MO973_30995 [Paenibacillus sp. TRM 82003]|nr:hypothetical protein [Paenibacillus sp. TRM 82003]
MNRKWLVGIVIALLLLSAGLFAAWRTLDEIGIINFMRPFQVIVDNRSSVDIVSVEIGIHTAAKDSKSTVLYAKTVRSGTKAKFKPDLDLFGEGSIYLTYTDSTGKSATHGVCSYTEYLSGHSRLTIQDDDVRVEEDCY